MPRLAFLSMDSLDEFVFDDDLAIDPLNALGWEVESVSWRAKEDWSRFDVVVIRTPWDYQDAPDEFLLVLSEIEQRSRLENPLAVVRWNLSKTYLRELEDLGVATVPTRWGAAGSTEEIAGHAQALGADAFIVKPVISANADSTFRLTTNTLPNHSGELRDAFSARRFMVQPFLPNVVDEGEFSLFYFNRKFSHAILKTPKQGDFRVQEEHGGIIAAVDAETALLEAGQRAIAKLPKLLYARADFVRTELGFLLMELELIEPALYFRMDPPSAGRFAQALDALTRQPVAA